MTDEKNPLDMSDEEIEAELARINSEAKTREGRLAKEAKLAAIRKDRLIKETEAKLGPEGRAFIVIEGVDGLLFVLRKPDPVMWHAFKNSEQKDTDWEKIYRVCVSPDVWDKVQAQYEERPGLENEMVGGILRMLGLAKEARLKK